MKDKVGWKAVKEFSPLRPKTCSYLTDDNDGDKKRKAQTNMDSLQENHKEFIKNQ